MIEVEPKLIGESENFLMMVLWQLGKKLEKIGSILQTIILQDKLQSK